MRLKTCASLSLTMLLACSATDPQEQSDGSTTAGGQRTSGESTGGVPSTSGEIMGSSGEGASSGDGSTQGSGGSQQMLHPSCLADDGLIFETPSDRAAYLAEGMTRYVEVVAPGGGAIPIYAQDEVSDHQLLRARALLRFFLTDVADTMYGTDKGAVADAMVANGAVLVMPNGAHEEGNEPNLNAQPLYADETPVEGSAWYLNNNWEHRDAAFEEIFHLVHDTGIGTYVPGALPAYQAALLAEAEAAIDDGRWGMGEDAWIAELSAEGSLAQEYIASVLDTYYGLWGAWDETPGGMWGIYVAKTREELDTLDPAGRRLIEAFLPPTLDYEVRLDPSLSQSFSMNLDPGLPYTHKSQYLVQVTLTGREPASIVGNDFDNTLRGNEADNTLDGGAGTDTVVYCNPLIDYELTTSDGQSVVEGPDGRDTLVRIERIQFADTTVTIARGR